MPVDKFSSELNEDSEKKGRRKARHMTNKSRVSRHIPLQSSLIKRMIMQKKKTPTYMALQKLGYFDKCHFGRGLLRINPFPNWLFFIAPSVPDQLTQLCLDSV
jgi:hypothetical protein